VLTYQRGNIAAACGRRRPTRVHPARRRETRRRPAAPELPRTATPATITGVMGTPWLLIVAGTTVLLAMVLPALALWWPLRRDPDKRASLASSLFSGAVVAFAVLVVQISLDARLRAVERDRQDKQRAKDEKTAAADRRMAVQTWLDSKDVVRGVVLADRELRGLFFATRDLRWARFDGADLRGAHFDGATLKNVHFDGARMERATFMGAILTYADLSGAHLGHADFTGATLWDADLPAADLRAAVLASAKLNRADLSGAHMEEAVLIHADLRGAELAGAHLTGARFDAQTRWPKGFDAAERGAVAE
jgi:uncharacterized protein YjbI with pentapeptide repeats